MDLRSFSLTNQNLENRAEVVGGTLETKDESVVRVAHYLLQIFGEGAEYYI